MVSDPLPIVYQLCSFIFTSVFVEKLLIIIIIIIIPIEVGSPLLLLTLAVFYIVEMKSPRGISSLCLCMHWPLFS